VNPARKIEDGQQKRLLTATTTAAAAAVPANQQMYYGQQQQQQPAVAQGQPPATTSNHQQQQPLMSMSVIDTPQGLPQCHECVLPKVYIRDCYPEYFDYLIELMNAGKRYIAVTGTAGIGKSVFYLYFFGKFKTANINRQIIMASYLFHRSPARRVQSMGEWGINDT
jgi:hypothetical protein